MTPDYFNRYENLAFTRDDQGDAKRRSRHRPMPIAGAACGARMTAWRVGPKRAYPRGRATPRDRPRSRACVARACEQLRLGRPCAASSPCESGSPLV
jgi:hypothetical protein